MNRLLASLCAVILLPAWLASAAAPLADRLPGQAIFYVGWAGQTEAASRTTPGRFLESDLVKQVLEGSAKSLPDSDASNVLRRKMLDLLPMALRHPAALVLTDIGAPGSANSPAGVLVVDLKADRAEFAKRFDALLAALPPEIKVVEQRVGEISCRSAQTPAGQVFAGYLGDMFFLALGPQGLTQLTEAAQGQSLAQQKRFADAWKQVEGDNLQGGLYVDVAAVKARVLADQAAQMVGAMTATAPAGNSSLRQTMEAQRILAALGLGKVTAVVGSCRAVGKGFLSRVRVLSPAPHQGVLMPLAAKPLEEADLAGLPADADVALAARISPSALLGETRRCLGVYDRNLLAQFDRQFAAAGQAVGLDIEKALASLGDVWTLSNATSRGGSLAGVVVTATVADAPALRSALETLERIVQGLSEGKVTVTSVKSGPAEIRYFRPALTGAKDRKWAMLFFVAPAYTIVGDKLYIAPYPQTLVTTLEGKNVDLPRQPAFAAARNKLAGKPSMVGYLNTPQVARETYQWLLLASTAGSNGLSQVIGVDLRPDLMPTVGALVDMLDPDIQGISSDEQGITFESYGTLPYGGADISAVPMVVSLALPAITTARTKAKQAASLASVNAINKQMILYCCEHNDQYPPDLSTLAVEDGMAPKMLVSPLSGRAEPKIVDGRLVGEVDYIYIRPKASADAHTIILYERFENSPDGTTAVGYADGRTLRVPIAQVQRQLEAQQKAP